MSTCALCGSECSSEYCEDCNIDVETLTYGSGLRQKCLKRLLERIKGDKK
jgi:hypothetical protein